MSGINIHDPKTSELPLKQPELVTLYGAAYSVYVRTVRLALAEKGVHYTLIPVHIFATAGPPTEHLQRHPFGRIPAFQHGDFCLYETSAITRYVDEAFPGPLLQPQSPQLRARTNQVISILDSYAYRSMVWDIYVERVAKPRDGKTSDEEKIRLALPRAATCLAALADIIGSHLYMVGQDLSLADIHAVPIFGYFVQAPESQGLLEPHENLRRWWNRMTSRASFAATITG
jgi:glutathione S-transferase